MKDTLKLSKEQNVLFSSSDIPMYSKTHHKENRAELPNFAAVQTCCVVTVRLPQTRYFQYCPFILPDCQAGILPKSRKWIQRGLKLSSIKTLLHTDLKSRNTALFRTETGDSCIVVLSSYFLCYCHYFTEKAQIHGIAYLTTNSSSMETEGLNTVKNTS